MQKNNEHLSIGFVGDVMLGRLVDERLSLVPSQYVWGNTLQLFHTTDVNIINLENAFTEEKHPVPKVFNFKSHPKNVHCLLDANIHICSIANNHILDFGKKGLLDTILTLDEAKILHAGAGINLADAKKPALLEKKGIRIAFLAYTDNEPEWEASDKYPGTRYIEIGNIEMVQEDIEKIKDDVDLIITSFHWGPNMRQAPPRHFIHFAHEVIEAGSDIFFGHSAHIFQGVEAYKHGLIMYDTGDFVDDYYVDPISRNDFSFFFLVDVNKNGFQSLKMIPTTIQQFQANIATGREKKAIVERMIALCKSLGTKLSVIDDGLMLFRS